MSNPGSVAPKVFDDAGAYRAEIGMLVPGYDALHRTVVAVLSAELGPSAARVGVVGCGPGRQLVALAEANPAWRVDGFDPAPAMVAAAVRAVDDADLNGRVAVHHGTAREAEAGRYDAAVSILVGHFIADDGARQTFIDEHARMLGPRGFVLFAEMMHGGPQHDAMVEAHVRLSRRAGLAAERVDAVRARLTGGFSMLSLARRNALLNNAGLVADPPVFSCLCLQAAIARRRASDFVEDPA